MKIQRFATLTAIIASQIWVRPASAQSYSDQDVRALIQRLDELEKKVKTLESRGSNTPAVPVIPDSATASEPAARTGGATVSLGANGLVIRSADTNFTLIGHGYVQADGRFYLGQKSTPDTFLLRRVRPIIEGTAWGNYDYRLMLDLGSGNVAKSTTGNNNILDDAYVNARFWDQFQVQAGKYKSPLGLERLQSTSDLLFVETGFATELTPNYDLGAMIHNSVFENPIGYSIGIFNGATDGGSDDQDADEGKDLVGRLFFQPFLKTDLAPLKRLGFGVAGSIGYHNGALPSYTSPGQQTIFSYATTATASGAQYRVDPQAYYYWGPFGILGEYVVSSQEVTRPGAPVERFNNAAWQVQASYFLTGEDNRFIYTSLQHVNPARNLNVDGSGFGAFELVARLHQLTLDPDIFKTGYANTTTVGSAKAATAWGVGLNWYLNSNLKVNLDYENTWFRGGVPAITGAVSPTARDEHAILTRVQLLF